MGKNDLLRSTLRGIKRGHVDSTLQVKIKCVIICDHLPTMLVSRTFLDYFTPVLILGSTNILQSLKLISTEQTIVGSLDSIQDETILTIASSATLCFTTICMNSTLMDWLLVCGISKFITPSAPRRAHKSWKRYILKIEHSTYGGVTDHAQIFYIFTQSEFKIKSVESLKHQRDAHTIVDDSIWCSRKRRKPLLSTVQPLQVKNVGTDSFPIYHIGGLLPCQSLARIQVITPSLGLSNGTWGIRKLSANEICDAVDISSNILPTSVPVFSLLNDNVVIPARLWMVCGCMTVDVDLTRKNSTTLMAPKRLKLSSLHPPSLGLDQQHLFVQLSKHKEQQGAVKSDDANVDVSIWQNHFLDEGGKLFPYLNQIPKSSISSAMDIFRHTCLVRWKRKFVEEYNSYLHGKFRDWDIYSKQVKCQSWVTFRDNIFSWNINGRNKYMEWWRERLLRTQSEWIKGNDALSRALCSSWWEWDDGSSPFYWRWPSWYCHFIRDGIAFPFRHPPPTYRVPQRDIDDPRRKQLVTDKLAKVLDRRYMGVGVVKSLTAFFDVPKGTEDIRMVYDGTVNGFNDSIEVPRFGLPTIRSHLRSMGPGFHMVDADVGECFLNFYLHSSLQPYVGVDLSHYIKTKNGTRHWVRWYRAGMGLKSSPYQACQAMMIVEEVVKGDRANPSNPFRWDLVIENLPGSDNYDPTKPWIYKTRANDGQIACDIFIYVDDLRVTGPNKVEAWQACCRAASVLSYLGVQDAPRKRRDSSNMAGAWAGSVVYTTEEEIFILVTEEKWIKAKAQVQDLKQLIVFTKVNRKRLQIIRGFLNYVGTTYPILLSYLMGLHLTIDGWRRGRDLEGWKKHKWNEESREGEDVTWMEAPDKGPETVEVKPRLRTDVAALETLLKGDKPPLRIIRSDRLCQILYGFGDASGSAFGTTLGKGNEIFYEYGQWCTEESEQSSNWRELKNLVDALEGWIQTHHLNGSQLFIFTDNATAEAAYWKGTSKSKKLCDLVLRLKYLSLWSSVDLHVIHVSGRRMKSQGTDGLSRGDQSIGVMAGIPMKNFVPLHLTPTQRVPELKQWLDKLVEGWNFRWLKTKDWFEEHHTTGNFIWDIAPAAGDLAYEMLDKARLKRPMSMHLLVIPRLFTGLWRRLLTRRSDCYVKIDWEDVWNLSTNFEPLLLFICIPFRIDRNFERRRDILLEKFQGALQECRVSKSTGVQQRNILRKFLQQAREIPGV